MTPSRRADKGYFGELNCSFLSLNQIKDGIMRKYTTTDRLTEYEKERNKKIIKNATLLSVLWIGPFTSRSLLGPVFTTLIKNTLDAMFRQMAFNLFRGSKIILAS